MSRLLLVMILLVAVACSNGTSPQPLPPAETDEPATTEPIPTATSTSSNPPREPAAAAAPSAEPLRPSWLGTRPLPLRADGFGEVQQTPPELQDRRLPTVDVLPPPPDDRFHADIRSVPDEVLARSTWSEDCPVDVSDLRYLTVTFHGFDGAAHTGELLVHRSVAEDVVAVFRRLHAEQFPIEEMRIVARRELDASPTGDGNNTTAFVCRPSRGATAWSQHARGLAIDVNPFHNPYVKDDLVLPELASAYTDRSWRRPGMIHRGDVVTTAFSSIGWEWGGDWSRPKDPMHFSRNGR